MEVQPPQEHPKFGHLVPYIRSILIPQIKMAHRWTNDWLLPTFNRIEEEADRIADQSYNEAPMDEWDDGSGAAERALEDGLDFYLQASAYRQSFTNLLFVHLFHSFEQQLAQIIQTERRSETFRFEKHSEVLEELFNTLGVDVTLLNSWAAITELQSAANTVKHVDAKASNALRAARPELFDNPNLVEPMKDLLRKHPKPVTAALCGRDLYLTPKEYDRKIHAILSFWDEFCAVLKGAKRVPNLRERVSAQRDAIIAIAAKHGASNPRLFGSIARDEAGPTSDVDLLVDFAPGTSLAEEDRLKAEVEALLERKVDLVAAETLKGRKRDRILKDAEPL